MDCAASRCPRTNLPQTPRDSCSTRSIIEDSRRLCAKETNEQGRGSEINNSVSRNKKKQKNLKVTGGLQEGMEGVCRKRVPAPCSSQSSGGNLIFHFSMIPVAFLLKNSLITSDMCFNGILPMTVRDG